MISKAVSDTLKELVSEKNVHMNEPMSAHTTFRVGGNAECMVEPETEEQLSKVRRYLKIVDAPFAVLGNGSNTIVRDSGYEGVIVHLGNKYSDIRVEENCIAAKAGAMLSAVARAAYENGLAGMEFASGIPGTVGGAVVMNAGAYGGEMSQIVTDVTVVDPDGEILSFDNETMEFGYRRSVIKSRPFIISEVFFRLKPGNPDEIKSRMDELAAKRREKQPLEYPSAGSTFKRPEGYFAGELIMKAGLRGFQVGGARVSDKHCGFVINVGNAKAEDVLDVIAEVQEKVKERFGVELEPEVVIL
jgi:UDP-N-acetylmuramate dehydrogenase